MSARYAVVFCVVYLVILVLPVSGNPAQQESLDRTATPYPTYTPLPTYTYQTPTTSPVVGDPQPPAPRDIPGLDQRIMSAADNQIHAIQLQIEIIQSDRLSRGMPLLQLASTHESPPRLVSADDPGSVPDPSRRMGIDSWYSARIDLPSQMITAVQIHTYQGPNGWGYLIVANLDVNGQRWRREINIGPESWRGSDWVLWEPD